VFREIIKRFQHAQNLPQLDLVTADMKRQSFGLLAAAVIVVATLASVSGASAAPPATQQLRGSIVSSTAASLTVKTADGAVTVHLGPNTKFVDATPGSIADIAPGKFLGIGSVPGTGFNRALEVTVFADSMRGTGEGDYPWDPGTRPSHSTMTNGTVAAPKSHSMMTNATVGAISGSGQKTITMNYKGGSRTLVIPAGTPVIRVSPGTKALLAVGKPVFVVATKAPAPNALFVIIGRQGTTLSL
jgi:hypothetical protein